MLRTDDFQKSESQDELLVEQIGQQASLLHSGIEDADGRAIYLQLHSCGLTAFKFFPVERFEVFTFVGLVEQVCRQGAATCLI